MEYWSKADDPTADHENLLNLFQIRVLKSNSLTLPLEKKLWNCLNKLINTNIRGIKHSGHPYFITNFVDHLSIIC